MIFCLQGRCSNTVPVFSVNATEPISKTQLLVTCGASFRRCQFLTPLCVSLLFLGRLHDVGLFIWDPSIWYSHTVPVSAVSAQSFP